MRIIAGKYKNREISAPPGRTTRPVLSRVRKAIFDTAAPVVEGGRILDLFAGSGGFVIEALSRGAEAAVAIDLDAGAVKAIRANLAHCGVREPVEIYKNDAFDAIGKLAARAAKFELISVAPPYWKGLQARALAALDAADLLAPGGLLFVQRDAKEDVNLEAPLARLVLSKQKVYGNTIVDWYGAPVSEPPSTLETSI
jgi:16S rRNA (guanine966-N2)-methyltransferase